MEVGSQDVARTGLKGKGLRLLHVYGDQLWSLGGTKASPDPSFTLQRIFPLQACTHTGNFRLACGMLCSSCLTSL